MPAHLLQLTLTTVALLTMPSFALALEVSPQMMLLGRDTSAQLLFKGFAEHADKVRVFCTAGDVAGLRSKGADLVADWVAPRSVEPQVILCAALTQAGSTVATFDLSRKETLQLSGLPPLSRVEVDVSGQRFGPVRADGEGRAEVQVSRTATAGFAQVTATPPSGAPVTLKHPFNRTQGDPSLLIPGAPAVNADGATSVTLHAFVIGDKGPLDESAVYANTPDGVVTLKRLSAGSFAGSWTPAARAADEDVTVSLRGRSARTRVRLNAGLRALASLHVRESVLAADGLAMTVVIARITDSHGRSLPQQPLRFTTNRGQIGAVTDRGDGTYVAPYTAPAGTIGTAVVKAELGGAQIAEVKIKLVYGTGISVEPLDQTLPADGESQTILRISARRDTGLAMPDGTVVKLKASLGEVPETTMLQDGRADVLFKAGTTAGAAVITVTSGRFEQTGVVQLVPGEPTAVEVRAEPNPMPCHRQAMLHVTVRDRFGNDVPSADVKLATGRGALSPLQTAQNAFVTQFVPECSDEGDDEVHLDAAVGEVKSTTTVKVQRREGLLGARVSLFGMSDFDSGTLGGLAVEVDSGLPFVRYDRLRLGVEFNAATGTRFGAPAALYGVFAGPLFEAYSANALSLSAGLGVDGHFMTGRLSGAPTDSAGSSLFLAGAHARIVGGWAVGPGNLVAQVRATVPLLLAKQAVAPTGVDVSMGYRVLF